MTNLRTHRVPAVAALALAAAATLGGCSTGVEGQNTPNGTQLRPSEVPVPPALPGAAGEHIENR
jgi:hypothetical protein